LLHKGAIEEVLGKNKTPFDSRNVDFNQNAKLSQDEKGLYTIDFMQYFINSVWADHS
jgi:hypothetical protein